MLEPDRHMMDRAPEPPDRGSAVERLVSLVFRRWKAAQRRCIGVCGSACDGLRW
jgi:hypothetical protein